MLYTDIEYVVKRCKTLEGRLKRELNAKGTGLGELTNSVKGKLPPETFQQLHEVNKIRNEIVHEEGRNTLKDKYKFEQLCNSIERSLDKLKKSKQVQAQGQGFGCLVTIFIILTLIVYFLSQNPS